jgi:molecular chaperone DnaK
MGRVIGIDLGTSTSTVAIMVDGQPIPIANAAGEKIIPSVVSFLDASNAIVGTEAKQRVVIEPKTTVYSSKRLIGRKFFSSEVKKAQMVMPYEIIEGPNDSVRIRIEEKDYSLSEIGSFILRELKKTAETYLGETVTQAVITVPAYFNDGQRQATKDAGTIAGLDVLRILNEPTAAALAYGFGQAFEQKVVIYDLGGGTFDVSVLEIGTDVFEVVSTSGDTYLGGDDFDDRLIDYFADTFFQQSKIDLRKDRQALQKLKVEAERVKIALTDQLEVPARIEAVAKDKNGKPLNLDIPITRNQFANITYDLIQRTFKVCDEALQAARLTVSEIDGVILVGGSTKMPIIQDAVKNYYLKDPKIGINPELVVAMGAAIQAAALSDTSGRSSLLLDVTPQSLGIGTAGGLVDALIARNSSIPVQTTRTFSTSRDNQTAVKIQIYQGESRNSAENELLGEFSLSGLPAAPRGEVKVEVTFDIDTDGLVSVQAKDTKTGREEKVKINVSGGLSADQIQQAKAETMQVNV